MESGKQNWRQLLFHCNYLHQGTGKNVKYNNVLIKNKHCFCLPSDCSGKLLPSFETLYLIGRQENHYSLVLIYTKDF